MDYEANGSLNIVRIIARNNLDGSAYAELVSAFSALDGKAYVRALDGSHYFAGLNEMVINPVIIRRCAAPWMVKIKLEG